MASITVSFIGANNMIKTQETWDKGKEFLDKEFECWCYPIQYNGITICYVYGATKEEANARAERIIKSK